MGHAVMLALIVSASSACAGGEADPVPEELDTWTSSGEPHRSDSDDADEPDATVTGVAMP